jgi:dGTPase
MYRFINIWADGWADMPLSRLCYKAFLYLEMSSNTCQAFKRWPLCWGLHMNWDRLLSKKRLGVETDQSTPGEGRSVFEADIDRVVYSGAFRRLSRKTQVHPLAANDHIHTRLTHSLEVAQVGRTLGKALGLRIASHLPEWVSPHDLAAIMQAACLAHDLGNPPFGHSGEEAMVHWFELNGANFFGSLSKDHKWDLVSFEGNAQSFRILTQAENHLFQGGLRLTYATLGTFLKYPWSSRTPEKKFGAFLSEKSILDRVANELGLVNKGNHKLEPTSLSSPCGGRRRYLLRDH